MLSPSASLSQMIIKNKKKREKCFKKIESLRKSCKLSQNKRIKRLKIGFFWKRTNIEWPWEGKESKIRIGFAGKWTFLWNKTRIRKKRQETEMKEEETLCPTVDKIVNFLWLLVHWPSVSSTVIMDLEKILFCKDPEQTSKSLRISFHSCPRLKRWKFYSQRIPNKTGQKREKREDRNILPTSKC